MSFWIFGKKDHGRRSLYSVNLPLHAILPLLLVLAVALMGMIRGCTF